MNRAFVSSGLASLALVSVFACTDDAPADGGTSTDTSTTEEVVTFDGSGDETDTGDGDGDSGDGDGDSGDGDGDTGDGDGDTGDGDGDTGDGDGDTGDGDGDTGDGDGDGDTGDGDGDTNVDADTNGDGDGDGDEAPFVISTDPVEGSDGVDPSATIEVVFSEEMDPQTITTNSDDDQCSGAIQVSADNFATCVQMAAAPEASNANQTFSVTPAAPLTSVGSYAIKVLGTVTDLGATPMGLDALADPFLVRYYHSITLDGVNDFSVDETFETSSVGHTAYVAWDATYLYLGFDSADLGANNNQVWWLAYLGGPMGTNSGVLYNSQQPQLPFSARWQLRWKASDDFGGALEWDGGNWIDPGFGPTVNSDDVAVSGDFLEVRVALADLLDPSELAVHMGMLREQAFNEASWAACPSSSYADGYDPDYANYFSFDLLGSVLPSDHDVL